MGFARNIKFAEKGYLAALIITAACVLMEPVLSYFYGYYGLPTSPLFFFLIFDLFRLALFLTLVVVLIVAVVRKRYYYSTTLTIIVFIAINIFALMLPGPGAILHGMQERIYRDHNLSEIRQFARDYDQLPKPSTRQFNDYHKTYTYEDLTKSGLAAKYPFLSCLGTPTAIENGNVVFIVDGDPLRGIYVTIDGTRINSSDYPSSEMLSASTDIVFVTRVR